MVEAIDLHKKNGQWMATYVNAPFDHPVRRAFGTDTLPTAFKATVLEGTVRAAILARNPGADVRIRKPTPQLR
ncbi:hypothetical protein LCGC14_0745230 [marine sediment metagenome]|uniref:Uncharacterized protein n=1 Tax=marine sediment metagenome TaxID=412755 RepID=A0A0F9Q5H2_9ZZZZ